MKSIRKHFSGLIIISGFIALAGFIQAQVTTEPVQSGTAPLAAANADWSAASDLQVMLQAVEMTPPAPAESAPRCGMFYSAQFPNWPPLPGDIRNVPVWNLGDNHWLCDDRDVDYAALGAAAEAQAATTMTSGGSMMAMNLASSCSYGNPVYLTNLVVSSAGYQPMAASFGIAGGTNYVPYDILMSTNLLDHVSSWTWLGIGYTSNRYTFVSQPADMAFYILAKPSKTMVVPWGDDIYGQCDIPTGITNAVQVTGGIEFSLALLNKGTVVGWGYNGASSSELVPTNLVGVTMIASGWQHNVALLTNGTVTAWGDDYWGQINVPSGLTNVTVISAQALHTLALRSDGTVVAWGYNSSSGETNVPAGLSNVVAIAAGLQFNLVVTTNGNGTVVAWGDNSYGQTNVPVGLSNVVDVAAGTYHSLALLNNGTVVAWGDDLDGERDVPDGLSNVVAIAASGGPYFPGSGTAYSLALKSDGTVVAWGDSDVVNPVGGLNDVIAIGAGSDHALAVRTGPRTPVITVEPTDQYQLPGGSVTFTTRGAGLYGVTYQWQTNGVNIAGVTNTTLTLTNVQAAQLGSYDVVVADNGGMGSIVSSNANLYFVTPPVIISQSPLPTNQIVLYQTNVTLSVVATAPGQYNGFPISYQWQFNGTNIVRANAASYTFNAKANSGGTYSVRVSNAVGSTNAAWQVTVYYPGLVISQQPTNQYQIAGGNVAFNGGGGSTNAVTYQWQFNSTNIAGATNATLTLTNVQTAQQGCYDFAISDGINNLISSNAWFYLVTPPTITSQTLPMNIFAVFQTNVTLNVAASAPGRTNGFPIGYQWQFNGTNISGQTSSNYTFSAVNSGIYSVIVTNAAGSTNVNWRVNVLSPGSVAGWGDDSDGQCDPPTGLTSAAIIATGEFHSVVIKDNGSVVQWGYDWAAVPASLTNAVAVAAGYNHSIAVRSDGTVMTWGYSSNSAVYIVPANLSGVKTVAAGWEHNVALLTNGTVMAWGDNYLGQTNVPADLTNVTAISACFFHSLALKGDGTVEGWGDNFGGEITAPVGLSNVVAIAAGLEHSLALKADGTVVAWGDNSYGQTNVPPGLGNVMAIAAGPSHSVALKNNGTVVSWGDNGDGQTNVPGVLTNVKLIAAGGNHTIAGIFSPQVQYPVDVTKDVLLIYNTNSTNSIALKDYYLAHRPMIAGVNVLGVACDVTESTTATNCDNQIVAPVLNWLTNNPTNHPEYLVLFFDMPTRIYNYDPFNYPSVTYRLYACYPWVQPFITYINGGTLADCEAYVDKLAYIGTNYAPGKLIISAGAGGYGNTNYYFDDTSFIRNIQGLNASNGVAQAGVSPASITYTNVSDNGLADHIASGFNVAGYLSCGVHSSLGADYAINGYLKWTGNSSWWIIETIESNNGLRNSDSGNFILWLSSNAFGGTNYSNTPVGAVCHVEEPSINGVNDAGTYFGLWASGKNFAICAWNSRHTPYFQAVGDPLVIK